ncbi:MAG: hypothetical protein COW75_04955 [Rhodobacterales bacterium CG18_big_fil_WC_8_21_14_2_50_71_9]|nr:MAG: hypothetical protein COW75_04955 [Rhodobacterales bacterium CG18_big_fil_WC_8_21_14_2_50_71_9]
MTTLGLTRHAEERIRQRGLRDHDLALLLDAATPLADDAWLMMDADADREIARRKREIEQLQRLRGCKIVVSGDAIVTVCHMRPTTVRRSLRRGRETR